MDRPDWAGIGYLIEGVEVYFARRDITQATDEEIARITAIVKSEVAVGGGEDRSIDFIEFESDFVDETCKYVVTTRVSGNPVDVEAST